MNNNSGSKSGNPNVGRSIFRPGFETVFSDKKQDQTELTGSDLWTKRNEQENKLQMMRSNAEFTGSIASYSISPDALLRAEDLTRRQISDDKRSQHMVSPFLEVIEESRDSNYDNIFADYSKFSDKLQKYERIFEDRKPADDYPRNRSAQRGRHEESTKMHSRNEGTPNTSNPVNKTPSNLYNMVKNRHKLASSILEDNGMSMQQTATNDRNTTTPSQVHTGSQNTRTRGGHSVDHKPGPGESSYRTPNSIQQEEYEVANKIEEFNKMMEHLQSEFARTSASKDPYKITIHSLKTIGDTVDKRAGVPDSAPGIEDSSGKKYPNPFSISDMNAGPNADPNHWRYRLDAMKLRFFDSYLPDSLKIRNTTHKLLKYKQNLKYLGSALENLDNINADMDYRLDQIGNLNLINQKP